MEDYAEVGLVLVGETLNSDVYGVTLKDICAAVSTLAAVAFALWIALKKGWQGSAALARGVAWCVTPARSAVGREVLASFTHQSAYHNGSYLVGKDCYAGDAPVAQGAISSTFKVWCGGADVTDLLDDRSFNDIQALEQKGREACAAEEKRQRGELIVRNLRKAREA